MCAAMLSQSTTVSMPATMAATSASPTSPTTKKRRRRAPATGAAEDCFTCRGAGIKCDRRRPYCGPCLDSNVGCKGYRTQLTWGVGVASRGKLRGLHLPVTNAQLEQRKSNDSKPGKQRAEEKATADERAASRNSNSRPPSVVEPVYATTSSSGVQRNSPPTASSRLGGSSPGGHGSGSNVGKLSIITNYDFVNTGMEPPPSSATGSAALSRSASSSALSSALSGSSPGPTLSAAPLSARPGLPSQRIKQEQHSPQSGISSPYSATTPSQPRYHSPIPQASQPPHHPQHYQTSSPANSQYHKSQYSHVTLPPQQQGQHTPSMLLSPMSEYEPSFPSHHQQHYPISSAPSSAPLYDLVTGVTTSSYHPSPAMTVATTSVPYTPPMAAPMHAPPRVLNGADPVHYHPHQNGQQWNGPSNGGSGVGNLHHQQSGSGNLSDLLYDEDMLGTL